MKVLVLEDDPLVSRGLLRILARRGDHGLHARTVQEAEALVQTHPDLDVAVADLGLPDGGSGITFLTWLARCRPAVRRVLISGADPPDHYRATPPVQAYLGKPFTARQLVAAIDPATTDNDQEDP
jgi:DNA-binding response OmpR family regulator